MIYIFTDGYADQFGGPGGKKFKYKQMEELLVKHHTLPLAEQKNKIEEVFNNWKGNLEQVDDICVIGIQI
jgi:serine phosphatase RsbU (regulator of sigma subunit)